MKFEQRKFKVKGCNTIYQFGFLNNGEWPISWTNSSGEERSDRKTEQFVKTSFEIGDWYFIEEDAKEVITTSALDKQVSGSHYKDCGIQPIEYIHANGLSYLEGNVIKYTTRHSKKNGKADIEKAIHYLELILEMEYKEK